MNKQMIQELNADIAKEIAYNKAMTPTVKTAVWDRVLTGAAGSAYRLQMVQNLYFKLTRKENK